MRRSVALKPDDGPCTLPPCSPTAKVRSLLDYKLQPSSNGMLSYLGVSNKHGDPIHTPHSRVLNIRTERQSVRRINESQSNPDRATRLAASILGKSRPMLLLVKGTEAKAKPAVQQIWPQADQSQYQNTHNKDPQCLEAATYF